MLGRDHGPLRHHRFLASDFEAADAVFYETFVWAITVTNPKRETATFVQSFVFRRTEVRKESKHTFSERRPSDHQRNIFGAYVFECSGQCASFIGPRGTALRSPCSPSIARHGEDPKVVSVTANRSKNPDAVALGRSGGLKGANARAEKMTPERRSEIAQRAAKQR